MKPVIDFFLGLGAWNWFVVAALLGALESVIPGVHFMWFGLAAIVMAALALSVPMPIEVQLIVFALLSLAFILIARRYWSAKEMITDVPDLNERGAQYVGRIVTVSEAIQRGRGKVQVGDTVWTAEGPDMPEGAQAKVTGVNGTVLIVGAG